MSEPSMQSSEDQVVVFRLGNEVYGVDIAVVREIIRMQPVTKVPGAPAFVEGVINLRGKVIPVIDLRKRFGLSASEYTKHSRISVVEIDQRAIGLIVDAVAEVLRIPTSAVEPPSGFITSVDSSYLRGIAKLDQRLIILLNLDHILTRVETGALHVLGDTERGEDSPRAATPARR
jgi:purine-binding chemotaxis protein CheW